MPTNTAIAEATRTLKQAAKTGDATARQMLSLMDQAVRGTLQEEQVSGDVTIVREGKEIILPEGMSYEEAHIWLKRKEQAEEANVKIIHHIDCFPLDGIIAVHTALQDIYGFATAIDRHPFWGFEIPPTQIEVPTQNGLITAQLGELRPPKWEGGFIKVAMDGHKVTVSGLVKRKFEGEVKEILQKAKKTLRERSIYKGAAIHVDLSFLHKAPEEFDILTDAPRFMDLSKSNLILNEDTEFELNTNIFMLLEKSQLCRDQGISLKHGALFKGKFGTGKTLTAKAIAKKATDNKWTFIYLKSADQFADGLRMAKLYSPAVVFVEDIDTAFNGDRDEDMNDLLNQFDGVDTKDAEIITVLTTNRSEEINPAFMRAGRIDSVIDFTAPNALSAQKFVSQIAGDLLAADVDLPKVGEALAGLVPAFIAEAISKAKRGALYRTGNSDISGQITTEDLMRAAAIVRKHSELTVVKEISDEKKLADALASVNQHGIDDGVHATD